MSDEAHWNERYRQSDRVWSGAPNAALVLRTDGLTPGTALDLGCGEGGDAIWLAKQGWRVTGTDISGVAVERATRHAEEAGVGDRVEFQRHDLGATFPAGTYDLVSAAFLHSWTDLPRERILRSAAAAVAPGGTLLVIGHAGTPSWEHEHPDVHLPTPDEVIKSLELADGEWEVLVAEEHERIQNDPDGNPTTRTDNTVKLHRRA